MPASSSSNEHAALEQAAWWYATLLDADDDADAHARWRLWLQQPGHARAWAQVEAVSQRFEPLRAPAQQGAAAAGLSAARRRGLGRRRVLTGLASLAALGVTTWQYPRLRHEWQAHTADYRAGTGDIKAATLDDGSALWLGPGTAVDVRFRPGLRALRLYQGEILVQTAVDATRGFMVETGLARLRALGARFNVRLLDDSLQVSVQEGTVELQTASALRRVDAGQQVAVDKAGLGANHTANLNADAWVRGLLMADQMPLGTLVAELARYRRGHLGVAPEIAHLPVAGVFPLREPDTALALLQDSLPVRVARPLPWWVTLEPAH